MRSESNIFSVFESDLLDLAILEEVMSKMVSKVESSEPGTLDYEWMASEDGKTCAFFERGTSVCIYSQDDILYEA